MFCSISFFLVTLVLLGSSITGSFAFQSPVLLPSSGPHRAFRALLTIRAAGASDNTEPFSSSPYASHNFGPASARDTILFTSERPGNPPGKQDTIPEHAVHEWIQFMKEHGIGVVVALLDENEFGNYCCGPGLRGLYEQAGMVCHCQSMGEDRAAEKILAVIDQAEENGQRVVAHCTGGVGRSGRVAAAWLVHRYGLSPEEATKEVLEMAETARVNRKGSAELLEAWLA